MKIKIIPLKKFFVGSYGRSCANLSNILSDTINSKVKGERSVKTLALSILIVVATIYSYPAYGRIRCENDIISVGDTSSEVIIKLSKCGEVLNKEIIKKETTIETNESKIEEKVKKEKLIELWYIRVKERGGMYCYPLTFEEGRLQNIGNWSKCD